MDKPGWNPKLNPKPRAKLSIDWPAHEDTIERVVGYHADQGQWIPALRRFERDDLLQELRLAVWQELARFDPQRGSLSTFVDRIAQSTLVSLIRHETAHCRDHRRHGPSLNIPLDELRGRLAGPTAAELPDQFYAYSPARELIATLRHQDRQTSVADFVASLRSPLRSVAELLGKHSEYKVGRLLGLTRNEMRDQVERLRRLYEDRRLRGDR